MIAVSAVGSTQEAQFETIQKADRARVDELAHQGYTYYLFCMCGHGCECVALTFEQWVQT